MAHSDPEGATCYLTLCHLSPHSAVLKNSPLFSSFKQSTKVTQGRKLCCNILKHKSRSQPVQGQYPVFLAHGPDSLEAASIGLVSSFSKWLLNHTWLPAFTHPNTGCASRNRCLCVQLLNQRVPLPVGTPCSPSGIHSFPNCDIQPHPFPFLLKSHKN